MDQPKGNVRARGRARQAREQARRPGEEPERGGASAAPAAVHPQQGNGGGRRTHRGAPRTDPVPSQERPPPQTQMEGVTEAMASASLGEHPQGRGRSRDGPGNDNTRPAHITDKQGNSVSKSDITSNGMTYEESKTFFNQKCGAVSKRTNKMCMKPSRCSNHTEEQRKNVRYNFYQSGMSNPLTDGQLDVDTVDEGNHVFSFMNHQPLHHSVQ